MTHALILSQRLIEDFEGQKEKAKRRLFPWDRRGIGKTQRIYTLILQRFSTIEVGIQPNRYPFSLPTYLISSCRLHKRRKLASNRE